MNNTVRRYPRSLAEAFPREHACAIERPKARREFRACAYFAALILFALLGFHAVARFWG